MEFIYIIIENGEPYLKTFKNYKSAIQAIKEKHREYLEDE